VLGPSATAADGDRSALSADGRLEAFGLGREIRLRDRSTGAEEPVSGSIPGTSSTITSREPAISYDGRFVAFSSNAPLVQRTRTTPGTSSFVIAHAGR
jgi:hypothetical protein